MEKLLNYLITSEENGQTVEYFLKSKGYSRHLLICLKNSPFGISVGGKKVYVSHRLSAGEILTIRLEEPESSQNIVPTPMELNIVYEDEDLLVINKPAGLPVHPSQGHFDNTLANGMAYYFKQKGEPFVFRAINRLDRDTTGLMILARHALSGALLSEMVKNRQIHREYLAVVSGCTDEDGTITAPIARVDGSTIERCVDYERGEYACTHYHRVHYNPDSDCSLLSLKLETGRTHQIRVHLNYIGHPLFGDFLYNPDYRFINRQSLHSHRLTFHHPFQTEDKKDLVFEAPLPDDMQFVYGLRSPLG
jgi:23S rRNA pseudouridine1911/1915/1917 synthase